MANKNGNLYHGLHADFAPDIVQMEANRVRGNLQIGRDGRPLLSLQNLLHNLPLALG